MTKTNGKPIVCSLSATDMAPRLAQIRNLTQRHLLGYRLEGRSLQLTYDIAAADELRRIVSLERDCCAFLAFEVRTHVDSIELHIVGPDQEGGDTQWLFSKFLPTVPPTAAPACTCCNG